MARPTKLTPEVQETICKAIRIGATYQAAAEAAGVSYETFNEWRKGKAHRFITFSEAVDRANADAQLDLLQNIKAAGDKDWRANAWVLEHRFKQDFGNSVDVTSNGETIFRVVHDEDERIQNPSPEPIPSQATGGDTQQGEAQGAGVGQASGKDED